MVKCEKLGQKRIMFVHARYGRGVRNVPCKFVHGVCVCDLHGHSQHKRMPESKMQRAQLKHVRAGTLNALKSSLALSFARHLKPGVQLESAPAARHGTPVFVSPLKHCASHRVYVSTQPVHKPSRNSSTTQGVNKRQPSVEGEYVQHHFLFCDFENEKHSLAMEIGLSSKWCVRFSEVNMTDRICVCASV
jgi:hypothetical protein